MTYCDDEMAGASFKDHLRNIPHTPAETDTTRYLRAFDRMLGEAPPTAYLYEEWIAEAARDAIRFVADDAFRRGFESCHGNVVIPLRKSTIAIGYAEAGLRQYGERVRNGIAMRFEDGPGVPTQLSVAIEEMALPPTQGLLK
ncbi:hypothetical protein [Shinella sp. BYT-45]|uniref:hypothetical protein n=1 Tax=Shinella sp. BYT-45 TaxID=3377377 RepID=UPI00397F02F6